jgi:hypothetical protein
MTHDYLRNGVTTLFAALDVLDGTVLGRYMQRHIRKIPVLPRHHQGRRTGRQGAPRDPRQLRQPQALPRYCAGSPAPRFVFHFTPTSGSWLNAIEAFFWALTRRRLKRGSFHSVVDLQAAINRYIAAHNADPKPLTWTKTPAQILAELNPLNAPVH